MHMKLFRQISLFVAVAIIAMATASCSNENDTVLISQQNAITKYLSSSHQPKLIPEEEVAMSTENEPHFYTHWALDIFRYIATYYDEGREDKPEVMHNSEIEIVYTAYIFKSGKPTVNDMFATNDADSIAELEAVVKDGLNTSYEWTTDPMVIKMGTEQIMPGLETALKGCREGDSVEIYLTYDKAYGKHYIGMVPAKSSLVWYIDIISVK